MQAFPAVVPLEGRRVVVIGGGAAARVKVRLFATSPAALDVFAESFETDFVEEFSGRARFHAWRPDADDLRGAALAIVALSDLEDVREAVEAARAAGVPVNAVDRPEFCDWTMPSIVDRGEVVVAIATNGAAPVLARDLRAKIEAIVPQGIGKLAAVARSFRARVAERFADAHDRKAFWERALRGPAAERALAGDEAGAADLIEDALENDGPGSGNHGPGLVHIVGAGPGDPELLTMKAVRVLQDADVIFHDSLVGPDVLDLARRDAERVYVGKRASKHAVPQNQIHGLMIAAARAGRRVVRLKGGDPFVFGRGGEEREALIEAGVEVHVVPGISSALGCAASAGVPLTHRDHAQSVTFVTGHGQDDGDPDLDWAALAKPNQTVVVFMGVATAARTAARLIGAGRAASTPVAVIENGTLPDEVIAVGTLGELARLVAENGIVGPALLVIGEVAATAAAKPRRAETRASEEDAA